MQSMATSPLNSSSSFYSWSNKGKGVTKIESRIDHVFSNTSWMDKFGKVKADIELMVSRIILLLRLIRKLRVMLVAEDLLNFSII